MTTLRTLIHGSSDEDRWFLCRGEDTADVFVFHEPHGPSDGTPVRMGIVEFLSTDVRAPERGELLRMIGKLVDQGHLPSGTQEPGPEPGAAAAEPTPGESATSP